MSLPTTFRLEGAVGSAQQLPHKGSLAAQISTDAVFISPVTDGSSVWELFVSFFFFPLAAVTTQFNI